MIKFDIEITGMYVDDEKLNVIEAHCKGVACNLKTAVSGCMEKFEKDHPYASIELIGIKNCVKI